MRIYLDTNIIINGSKDEDIKRIVTIANSQRIIFVYSQTVRSEQKKRSLNHYSGDFKKSAEWYKFVRNLIKDEAIIKKAHEDYWNNYDKLQNIKQSERKEWEFWKGSKFDIPRCTFEGLLVYAQAFTNLNRFDTKGEIIQLTELIEKYHLTGNDAIHAMGAHSEESDYFLSNDKQLINKLKKVSWLRTKPITPIDLLKIFNKK